MEKREMIEMLINHYSDGNKAQFAAKIGIKPQSLSMWITRNSFDAEAIYKHCENVSAGWLLSGGEGDMLRTANAIISADHGGIAAAGNVHGNTTTGDGATINNYSGNCNDDKPSQIIETLSESVATLTRELETSQEQKSKLIDIIGKLTDS